MYTSDTLYDNQKLFSLNCYHFELDLVQLSKGWFSTLAWSYDSLQMIKTGPEGLWWTSIEKIIFSSQKEFFKLCELEKDAINIFDIKAGKRPMAKKT